jgi:hypothetical protein
VSDNPVIFLGVLQMLINRNLGLVFRTKGTYWDLQDFPALTHHLRDHAIQNLYVGVTRVRSRLWVLESNSNTVDSVISLFNKTAYKLFPKKFPKELVEVVREHGREVCPAQCFYRKF